MAKQEEIKATDLINYSNLSLLLTGRTDILRQNRVQKKHKIKVNELLILIEYWIAK